MAKEKALERWRKQRAKYKTELKTHKDEAEEREKKSEAFHQQSEEQHHLAKGAGRATLFLELGIVITSLAVLTRKRPFWLAGVILAAIGAIYGSYVLISHLLLGH